MEKEMIWSGRIVFVKTCSASPEEHEARLLRRKGKVLGYVRIRGGRCSILDAKGRTLDIPNAEGDCMFTEEERPKILAQSAKILEDKVLSTL